MSRLALTFAALALCASALAQSPAAPSLAKVRSLYAEWSRARVRVDGVAKELKDAPRDTERFRQLSTRLQELTRLATPLQQTFQQAFGAADWVKLDVRTDAVLLQDALPALARDYERPQVAIAAGKFFLANFAKDDRATAIAGTTLPMALLAGGNGSEAKALLEQAVAAATGAAKVKLLLTLGDVEAADGRLEQSTRCYELAFAGADAKEKPAIAIRRELIGKPVPVIHSTTWFGAAAKPLTARPGKVLLIDFFASWCPPCRTLMPAVNELYGAHRAAGLEVVGVTRFYANGYLPASPEQMRSGGATVLDMDAVRYREHVAAFRQNAGIDYPFLVGTEQDFKTYQISSIPTVVLVGRDGKVASVMMGASCEPVLRYAVAAALAVGKR